MARKSKLLALGLLITWFATGAWQVVKPMPPGTGVASPTLALPPAGVEFLHDTSYLDADGRPAAEQHIFDAVFDIIDQAENQVVLDFFLVNDDMGRAGHAPYRASSRELADRLIARKRERPGLRVLFVTDPINDVYGGQPSPLLAELSAVGIDVVRTDLTRLRDSNPAYSAVWRLVIQWLGNSPATAWLPNPFEGGAANISLRSWLALANFKANHRKLVVADGADGRWRALVTSANPHDASSRHSNVALRITGGPIADIMASESAIARFSGWTGAVETRPPAQIHESDDALSVTYLTEESIRRRLLAAIDDARTGDAVDMAVFYLSDRRVIQALLAAAARGAAVRLILDPNKDAFGMEKDGVPNRPVARELVEESSGKIAVRWHRTAGEQFHAKLTLVRAGGRALLTLGSANYTRRNLGNYNLEANLEVGMAAEAALAGEVRGWFDRLWYNEGGIEHTLPFETYRDDSRMRYWRYRFMEATGFSTF